MVDIDEIFNRKKPVAEPVEEEVEEAVTIEREEHLSEEDRALITKDVERAASLLSAHLLLPEGSKVVDTGCDEGKIAYLLAKQNPRAHFIGVDKDAPDIEFANKHYKLPNLSFVQSDLAIEKLEDGTLDAVINNNILHGVYSRGDYNPDEVSDLLQKQVAKLKDGGTMVIRDYMQPLQDQMVLLELSNKRFQSQRTKARDDAELLLEFSQKARPLPGGLCEGFFIEEVKPVVPDTRLFRLPHKWALEFIHRKDDVDNWAKALNKEFTFFTYQDYQREFAKMGMRTIFSAPYWDPWIVEHNFNGKFRMYREDGTLMQNPATNYFIVAQKSSGKKSMLIQEKRASQKPTGDLPIVQVRDKATGKVQEIVQPYEHECDVIPFRITPDDRMIIYLNSGAPRPVINAVPRGNSNLDEKKWSGHLIEPLSMTTAEMTNDADANKEVIYDHIKDNLGLRPKSETSWYLGDTYFPAPDLIDTAIEPVFVEVENPFKTLWDFKDEVNSGFTSKGRILELDATDVIAAAQVGMLPEPRLEMYAMDLIQRYKIKLPAWVAGELPEVPQTKLEPVDPNDLLKEAEKKEFVEEKGEPKYLKPVKAVFVEDGTVGSTTRGIAANDVEFIVTQDGVENIAVVLPLNRSLDDELMVMLQPEVMSIPNRRGGDGTMLNVPSFKLPKDVVTIEDARAYVARQFSVPTDKVTSLGESYFTHVGIMPQRVYPFMVAADVSPKDGATLECCLLKKLIFVDYGKKFPRLAKQTMQLISRVHMRLGPEHPLSMKNENKAKYKGFSLSKEKVALDAKKTRKSIIPSVILGEAKRLAPKKQLDKKPAAPKPKAD